MTDTEVEPTVEVEPEDGKTFSADYVKKLRDENAKQRNELKDLRPAATRLKELEDSQKSEIEKVTARAEAAELALTAATLDRDRMAVVLEKGLDPDLAPLLSGATKADIEKQAELLAARLTTTSKPAPKSLKSGASGGDGSGLTPKERAAAAVRQLGGSA